MKSKDKSGIILNTINSRDYYKSCTDKLEHEQFLANLKILSHFDLLSGLNLQIANTGAIICSIMHYKCITLLKIAAANNYSLVDNVEKEP